MRKVPGLHPNKRCPSWKRIQCLANAWESQFTRITFLRIAISVIILVIAIFLHLTKECIILIVTSGLAKLSISLMMIQPILSDSNRLMIKLWGKDENPDCDEFKINDR